MAKTHHSHEVQFTVEKAKPKIDDYDESPLEVQKFYIHPVSDEVERISYNTDVETEEERKVDGIPTQCTSTRMATLSEIQEKLKQLAQLADEYDELLIEVSFTEWDRSADEETDSDDSVYFMRESHLDDLKVVGERVIEEEKEKDAKEENADEKNNGDDLF